MSEAKIDAIATLVSDDGVSCLARISGEWYSITSYLFRRLYEADIPTEVLTVNP
jgi:hypothetical protein